MEILLKNQDLRKIALEHVSLTIKTRTTLGNPMRLETAPTGGMRKS